MDGACLYVRNTIEGGAGHLSLITGYESSHGMISGGGWRVYDVSINDSMGTFQVVKVG